MHPSQDPIINRRILQHHPYPIHFPALKEQREPHVSSKKTEDQTSKLPPELWAEVFLYCLPEPPPADSAPPWYNRDRYISRVTAPLLLCQICRTWREVAVRLPQLWQRLGVYVSMGSACPAPALAELWLARSGSLPLSLSLHQQNESNLNALVAGRILGFFMKHTARWIDIDFHLAGSSLVINTAAVVMAAPCLRRFRLRTSYRVFEKEERYIFGVFQEVPRLMDLHVSRVPELDMLGNSTVDIPWHQLNVLSLDYVPSIGTSLHILSKCQSITQCTLKIDALFGPLLDDPLVHPFLRSLTVSIGYEHLTGFFSRITLPALQHLAIRVRGPLEQYVWPEFCFQDFLMRSEAKLMGLEIFDSGMRAHQFICLLKQPYLQALETLVVDDRRDWTWNPFVKDLAFDLLNCTICRDVYATIAALDGGYHDPTWESEGSVLADRACFLPNLEVLVVRGNCLETSDGTIADMVESRFFLRARAVIQLKCVKLEIPSSHLSDLQRLKKMEAHGLELELGFI